MQALKPHTVDEDQKKRVARFAPRQPGGGRINAQSVRALLLAQIIPSELRRAGFPGRSLSRRAGIINPAASKPTGLSSLAPARRCRREREEFKAQQREPFLQSHVDIAGYTALGCFHLGRMRKIVAGQNTIKWNPRKIMTAKSGRKTCKPNLRARQRVEFLPDLLGLADIPLRSLRPIADDGRTEGGMIAAIGFE